MKNIKGFVIGFLCASILMISSTSLAQDIYKKIDVVFDSINIVVNGEQKQVGNLLYNGSTYIKLRDLSEVLGKDVDWEAETSTAYIDEKDALKKISMFPYNKQEDYYTKFGYLDIVFNKEMKPCTDLTKVKFESTSGEKVQIKSIIPGENYKTNLLLELENNLKLDTEYVLSIPKNTLEAVDGKKYLRDINVKFKTAHTVLTGKICSNEKVVSATVKIGTEIYSYSISQDNTKFMVTNIEGGKAIIKLTTTDGRSYEKEVLVQDGMINNIDLYPEFK